MCERNPANLIGDAAQRRLATEHANGKTKRRYVDSLRLVNPLRLFQGGRHRVQGDDRRRRQCEERGRVVLDQPRRVAERLCHPSRDEISPTTYASFSSSVFTRGSARVRFEFGLLSF